MSTEIILTSMGYSLDSFDGFLAEICRCCEGLREGVANLRFGMPELPI